jgi:PAS domain S-box-containing protein
MTTGSTNYDSSSLAESEQRLRLALETGRIGLWVWNSTDVSNAGDWSERLKEIFGLPPETTITHDLFLNCVHPDDRARVNESVMQALAGKDRGEYAAEYRAIDQRDSSEHWVSARGQAFFDEQGAPVRFIGTVMDITDRRRSEELQRQVNVELEQRVAERTAELALTNEALRREIEERQCAEEALRRSEDYLRLTIDTLRASEHVIRGHLGALADMLGVLAQEGDPDQLPRHVVRTILTQLGAASVTIWERNGDKLDLLGINEEGSFRTGKEAGYFEGSIPVVGEAPPLWVEAMQTGSHTLIEDIDKEASRIILGDGRTAIWHAADLTRPFAELKVHMSAQGVRGLLIAPMLLAGELAGIIGIRFHGTRVFNPEEIDLTKALAHQAMLAIQLMRLSQESRRAAVVAERNRLARDIHDTLAQGFTGVIVQLEAAEDAQTRQLSKEACAHIARARDLARDSLHEARRSIQALRPQALERQPLCEALAELIEKMTAGTSLQGKFSVQGEPKGLQPEGEETLLRIAQEVLTNALRHANARHFDVITAFDAARVHLELRDDGRGFDPSAQQDGYGLLGIRERVMNLGGELRVESRLDAGTVVRVSLSLSEEEPFPL